MNLTKDQAVHCADILSEYFGKFNRIDEYMRARKINYMRTLPVGLPGMGIEQDLFSDYTMHPNDMDFDVVELPRNKWFPYLNIISSHINEENVPGRRLFLAVIEKKTNKWVGFIRLGSPVINMKPRNLMLQGVFSQDKASCDSFNKSSIMGCVIVPTQPFGFNYLGGKLLAAICCSHKVRYLLNSKYDMNTCLFETTSLYGSSKSSSQYDGMKPYLRFKGLTDSEFIPMLETEIYEYLKSYTEKICGQLIHTDATSYKLKTTLKIIGLVKKGLRGEPEFDQFDGMIKKAMTLTEKKRYYASNYGFSNFTDVVMGKTTNLIPDKENYDKFKLESIVEWWKRKASTRYETLRNEGRLRNEIEVWTGDKEIDIIR